MNNLRKIMISRNYHIYVWLLVFCMFAAGAGVAKAHPPAPRVIDLKTSDGIVLKATYFAAGEPGPGVLLLHQVNRTRKDWDEVAKQLAAAGINTITLDLRGFGESGGMRYAELDKLSDEEYKKHRPNWPEDINAAFQIGR